MSSVRDRLIDATFEEVFTTGYSAASLANILKRADVKKGAMYHYFPSKKDMVLAMIDEKLEKRIEKKWVPLVEEQGDLIELMIKIIKDTKNWDLTNGCPLGNLLQEPLDGDIDFADILNSIVKKWKTIFTQTLNRAIQRNQINSDTDVEKCATFLIASIEGALLMTKKSKDDKDFEDCMDQLCIYLNMLRKGV